MQLSDKTLSVMKNFSTINPNLLIQKGDKIRTMAVAKNILAEFESEESFPDEYGIFNLNEFLGVIGLFHRSPSLKFTSKYVVMSEGKTKVQYVAADKSVLVYPQKAVNMPNPDVTFTLTGEQIANITKSAATLSLPDVAFIGNGKTVSVKVLNKADNTSNNYTIELDSDISVEFTAYFKVENLKLLQDSYSVSISKENISKWVGENLKVTYYIAAELDSSFTS